MNYENFSDNAPINNTGQVSVSSIRVVQNNPTHPESHNSNFPTYYDQFVNKTEARSDQPILITAEKHETSELYFQSSTYYLHLYHMPAALGATTITTSDGVIDTGNIDYTLGLIRFTTAPTGTFYVNYMARADTFYSEHINAMQNAIMNIQRVIGAGSLTGEGLRNARILVTDLPANASTILPNAIEIDNIAESLSIKGVAGEQADITIGNGMDNVTINADTIVIHSTETAQMDIEIGNSQDDMIEIKGGVWFSSTGGTETIAFFPTGDFGNAPYIFGDPLQSHSKVFEGIPGPYAVPTGASVDPFQPLVRVFGDLQVLGHIHLSGTFIAASSSNGTQVSYVNESLSVGQDLSVTGNTTLGDDSNTSTVVEGSLTANTYINVLGNTNDISAFNTPIIFKNQGNVNNGFGGVFTDTQVTRNTKWFPDLPFHIGSLEIRGGVQNADISVHKNSHVDGLDPSYIAKSLIYRAHDRSDFKNNCVNLGPYEGYSGAVTHITAPATSLWRATGFEWPTASLVRFDAVTGYTGAVNDLGKHPMKWHHAGGDYYDGKFSKESIELTQGEFTGVFQYGDADQWKVLWLNNDTNGSSLGSAKYGARVPLQNMNIAYYTGSPAFATGVFIQLSRSFLNQVNTGDVFSLYHPKNSVGNALRYSSSTVIQVYASIAEPIICTINGIKKMLTSPCTESITSNYTGMHYVFMSCRTPEIAKSFDGHILESEPTIILKTNPIPDDSQVLLGEFYSTDPGAGIDQSTIKTYRYNSEFDTLWFRTMAEENLQSSNTGETMYRANTKGLVTTDTGTIEAQAAYAYGTNPGDVLVKNENEYKLRIYHNLGSLDRAQNSDIKVYVAPNQQTGHTGNYNSNMTFREGPDYAYITELKSLKYDLDGSSPTLYPCYEVVHIDRNYTDLVLYEVDKVPGAVIGARDVNRKRNLTLTGTNGTTNLVGAGVFERERKWWWTRVVIN